MAEKILIMGESGTGKSTSLRNCNPETTAIVNPVGKPLPFKGSKKFTSLNGVTKSDEICEFMKDQVRSGKKIIVVDDFQYILSVPYMSRIKENGWDKWNDFGSNYYEIINICNELPDDVIVYYLSHCETLENGVTTVKLIGKMLREKITVEGLFTIVLKTGVSEGKYYFFTQNSGKDTVKSPMGMFDSFSIDNDLAYVDAKIRNYYEMDGAVSDTQMAKMDEEKAGEVEKPTRKSRREKLDEKKREELEKIMKGNPDDPREEIPFEEAQPAEDTKLPDWAEQAKEPEKEDPVPEPAKEEPAPEAPSNPEPATEEPTRRRRRSRS